MTDESFGDLLTVRQVSEILLISERSVREFISCGELRASKVGQWRIPRSAVREFFHKRSNEYESKFQQEIDHFIHNGSTDVSPSTMVIRDYYSPQPVDLIIVEKKIEAYKPKHSGLKWRYTYREDKKLTRHIFFGDLHAICHIINVLDDLYMKAEI